MSSGSVKTSALHCLENLKAHPNFKMPDADGFNNPILYSCICVAQLISPLQEEGESTNIECIDLAAAIKYFSTEITNNWLNRGMQLIKTSN